MRSTTALQAVVVLRSGERRQFIAPDHHRIYTAGDDYVIGYARTGVECFRIARSAVSTIFMQRIKQWLT